MSERNIYECYQVKPMQAKIPGRMIVANMSDAAKLSQMSFEFQQEEYGRRSEKTKDEIQARVIIPGIRNKNMFKWVDKGEIKSVLQLIVTDDNAPSIMHFFTNKQERGKGYGYALAWKATDTILRDYESCGLITNRGYEPSNKVFEKIGYEKVYDWIKVIVEPATP